MVMKTMAQEYEDQGIVAEMRKSLDFLRKNSKLLSVALESTHRTEQQLVMKDVVVAAIKHWAETYNDKEYLRYDGRNEATVTLCDRIVREIETLDGLPLI
jgi:hypothetical protein